MAKKPERLDLSKFSEQEVQELLDLAYLELGNIHEITLHNKLLLDKKFDKSEKFLENFVDFLRDPNYLHFFCQNVLNVTLLPFQLAILHELWTKPFPMLIASRGASKTMSLAVYICCRAVLDQGCRIVVVGAALRQSMLVFNYVKNIWDNAPILQDICGGKRNEPRKSVHSCTWSCGNSEVKFLPLGNGETIRGVRATHVVADEFGSINPEIFETVVRGFAAVKSNGLIDAVTNEYRRVMLENLGLITEDQLNLMNKNLSTSTNLGCNQIIISGTASFKFNHFYKYYRYYKAIIESAGDTQYLKTNYSDMPIVDGVDSTQYCIIRLPYDLVPPGMMDKSILAQGRATMNSVIFDQEYGTIFPDDSDGFYPASTLYSCTCPIEGVNGQIIFGAKLTSDMSGKCFMGIDPASEHDNFAINIIEVEGNIRKVIYQWSTNRKKFQELKNANKIDGNIDDYLTFCIRHIRSLLRRFPIELICMDAGGGGLSIKEGLKDKSKFVSSDDVPVYDIDDENDLGKQGRYILKMINFQSDEFRKESHHGLKTDLSNKKLLFPQFDTVDIANAGTYDSLLDGYENLEDCYVEIEELKNETMLIKHEQTITGSEKWDVPKLRVSGADEIKKRLKKDRFSSMLLSNWGCRIKDAESSNASNYDIIGTRLGFNKQDTNIGEIQYLGAGAKRLRQLDTIFLEENYRHYTR